MKLKQNESEIVIKNTGASMLGLGLVFLLVGLGFLYLMFTGQITDDQGRQAQPWVGLLFSLVFGGAGIAIAFSATNRKTVLSKVGESYYEVRRILDGKTARQPFRLTDVAEVRLARGFSSSGKGRASKTTSLLLVMKDSSELELGSSSGTGGVSVNGMSLGSFMGVPLKKEADIVAQFIGVQVGVMDMTLGGMVGAMREAITTSIQSQQTPDFAQKIPPAAPVAPVSLPAQTPPVVNPQTPYAAPVPPVPPIQSAAPPVPGQQPPVIDPQERRQY